MKLTRIVQSLGFVSRFVRRFTALTPFGAILAPTLGALSELIADAIRGFFNGLALAFKNPTVLIVVFVAMGYGYFNGYVAKADALEKANAEIVKLRQIKRCRAPAKSTEPPNMWDSIFR